MVRAGEFLIGQLLRAFGPQRPLCRPAPAQDSRSPFPQVKTYSPVSSLYKYLSTRRRPRPFPPVLLPGGARRRRDCPINHGGLIQWKFNKRLLLETNVPHLTVVSAPYKTMTPINFILAADQSQPSRYRSTAGWGGSPPRLCRLPLPFSGWGENSLSIGLFIRERLLREGLKIKR